MDQTDTFMLLLRHRGSYFLLILMGSCEPEEGAGICLMKMDRYAFKPIKRETYVLSILIASCESEEGVCIFG
jgi:hypothetical protein